MLTKTITKVKYELYDIMKLSYCVFNNLSLGCA